MVDTKHNSMADFEKIEEEDNDNYERGNGKGGGRDYVPVPVFNGIAWRDFQRRLAAWKLSTTIRPEQQGPAVYARLQDEAWQAVEDLPLEATDATEEQRANGDYVSSERGLEFMMAQLRERFEEQEILRQGDVLFEFFSQLRRRPGEQVRAFRRRFNTLVHRLARFAVVLPSIVLGWFFLEKLRLPAERRAMVLASCSNNYEFERVIQAAERNIPNVAEFDRQGPSGGKGLGKQGKPWKTPWSPAQGGKQPWQPRRPHKPLYVESVLEELEGDDFDEAAAYIANGGDPTDLLAIDDESGTAEEQQPEEEHGDDDELDEETYAMLAEAYVAGLKGRGKGKPSSAKEKMRFLKNQRGFPSKPQGAGRGANPLEQDRAKRIAMLKANSTCRDCDEKGHWKGDPECPRQRAQRAHVAGVVQHDVGAVRFDPEVQKVSVTGVMTQAPLKNEGFYCGVALWVAKFVFVPGDARQGRLGDLRLWVHTLRDRLQHLEALGGQVEEAELEVPEGRREGALQVWCWRSGLQHLWGLAADRRRQGHRRDLAGERDPWRLAVALQQVGCQGHGHP